MLRAAFAHILLSALLLGCGASPEPTDPPPGSSVPGLPPRAPGEGPHEALSACTDALLGARDTALDEARHAPAHLAAQRTLRSALDLVDKLQKARIPALRWQASQIVALALHSADLRGVYPPPTPTQATRTRPRKTLLQPGVLTLYYQKSGERFDLQVYDAAGRMRPEALATFSRALYAPGSDPRYGDDPWIAHHPRLLAMLYYTAHHHDKPIEIISAFRIPRGRAGSNHGKGRAVDIRLPQVKRGRLLRYLDRSFTAAGIGWYPNSTFVHLDTRRRSYHWTDRSRPGQRQRTRKRKAAGLPGPGTDPTQATVHVAPLSDAPTE